MTKEQENFIKDNYLTMYYKDIAKHLGVSMGAVRYVLEKSGLPEKKRLHLTDAQKEYMITNYLSMSYKSIGEHCGLTAKQVEGWLRNHVKDKQSKIREFNKTYFQTIDTPDKAYWLGFIYADGWITKQPDDTGYEFGIELQRADKPILEKLNDCLGGQHRVYDKERHIHIAANKNPSLSKASVLRVYSRDIVEGLHANGIDYRKTTTETIPIVDDRLFADFLRGYIDGDGCLHHMRGHHLAVHITSANQNGLKYIQTKLKDLYNIDTKIYAEHLEQYRTKYRLYCFRNDDVKRLLDTIYADPNAIKLDRKYKIYLEHYGLAA